MFEREVLDRQERTVGSQALSALYLAQNSVSFDLPLGFGALCGAAMVIPTFLTFDSTFFTESSPRQRAG